MIKSARRRMDSDEWINEITVEIDTCLLPEFVEEDAYSGFSTYVVFCKEFPDVIPIRYPGCTRGGIFLDSNDVITEISPGYTKYCYSDEIDEKVKRFVGRKLLWPEGVVRR
jgi:hypothetical protein